MITEAGIIFVVILISSAGILAGKKVRSSSDFLTANGQASTLLTTGAFLGIIGSQSTIGTAQLAFTFGLSAWWFTLGSALGLLAFALFYALPLRHSGRTTQFQLIADEYGHSAKSFGAILCTTGTFISVIAQVTACIGFITALYPSITLFTASALTVILMCLYIVMGGTWGAGMAGIVKTVLLYGVCMACQILVLVNGGGFSQAEELLCSDMLGPGLTHEAFSAQYLSFSARGMLKDYGSCISLVLGVLSTQTYMQYALSAKNDRTAVRSILLAAALVPPVGIAGVYIGLFMRSHYMLQAEMNVLASMHYAVPDLPVIAGTIQVFPKFIMNHVHPALSGIMLGTLLVTIVGGSSGLLLGISAILTEDIFSVRKYKLLFSRMTIILTLTAAAVIANVFPSQAINDLGFLSMTLRACVVFMPLTCALALKGRIRRGNVLASIVLAPLGAIFSAVIGLPVEPLFVGMGVSFLLVMSGLKPAGAA
ncbi:MAG: sodium:solute symporter family protein [Synergistaceae bacterium]|nr:sodium:solute symporter family protein [Synergistaceae bacterium]